MAMGFRLLRFKYLIQKYYTTVWEMNIFFLVHITEFFNHSVKLV